MNSPSSNQRHCQVCYDDLTFATKTSCGHDEICAVCHLRLRHLHKDIKCPICKTSNEKVVVDRNENQKSFDDYPIYGTELGSNFFYRDDVGMFFPVKYYEETIQPMFLYRCCEKSCGYDASSMQKAPNSETPATRAKKPATPLQGLQDHLRAKHRKELCGLCVENNRDFVDLLPRLSPNAMKNHMNKGDPGSAFRGHPLCEFCKKRFYDITHLHAHLNKNHYKCHVCEAQELPNQFFKDYTSLNVHFDNMHFLCKNPMCLAAKFVVFSNEIEFKMHQRDIHGVSSSDTKINLEFRYRRSTESEPQTVPSQEDFNYGVNGQVFVPEDLPTSQEEESLTALHPAHAERTAQLIEQAAALRTDDAPEAFPTLSAAEAGSTGGQGGFGSGWSSAQLQSRLGANIAGEVTEESFPALPSGSKSAVTSRVQKLRPRAQHRAIAAAANGWTVAGGSGSSSSSGVPSMSQQQSNLTTDQFPSLGSGSSRSTMYPAANAFARKNRGAPLNTDNVDEFPSMGTSTTKISTKVGKKGSVRDRLLSSTSKSQSYAPANTLQGASTRTKQVSVDDMKAGMGAVKYKQLKRHTKDFALGNLQPDAYVDHCATLFDGGYSDPDFWNFLPALMDSFPNQADAASALSYMDNLRRMQNGAVNVEQRKQAPSRQPATSAQSNWNSVPSLMPEASVPTQRPSSGWTNAAAKGSARLAPRPQTRLVAAPPRNVPTKKKAAWNGGGKTTVVQAKAPPGSVSAAVASQQPQSGSATKFMAKAQKQSNQQNHKPANGENTAKKKKKKQNKNELRQLAFG